MRSTIRYKHPPYATIHYNDIYYALQSYFVRKTHDVLCLNKCLFRPLTLWVSKLAQLITGLAALAKSARWPSTRNLPGVGGCCFECCFALLLMLLWMMLWMFFGCFLDVALAKSTRWPSAMHLLSVGGCWKWCNGAMQMVQDDPLQCICLVLVDVARRDNPTLSRIMAPGAGHPSPTPCVVISMQEPLCWVTYILALWQ